VRRITYKVDGVSVFAEDVDCLVDKFLFSAVNDKEFSVAGGTITSY
jgi:hypothetical protein